VSDWVQDTLRVLALHKYSEAEVQRLDEKARLMKAGIFDERAREHDSVWRAANERMVPWLFVEGSGNLFADSANNC
jgi:hypothetical protein